MQGLHAGPDPHGRSRAAGHEERPQAVGRPVRGSCARNAATCSRAIRRWATACRSIRSRGSAKSDYPYVNPPDPLQATAPLRSHAEIVARLKRRATLAPVVVGRGGRRPWPRRPTRSPGFKESAAWIQPHGDVCRAARRQALHLHAADRDAGRLSGIGRCRRVDRGRTAACRSSWKATNRQATRA